MKQLYLIRHAKSSEKQAGQTDFERPLSRQGIQQLDRLAKSLQQRNASIQQLWVSAAKRTQMTADILNHTWRLASEQIVVEPDLYLATLDQLLDVVWSLDDAVESVALIGHNPGLSHLAQYFLTDSTIELATAELCHIEFATEAWHKTSPSNVG